MPKIHRFIGPWQLGTGTVRIDDADLSHQTRSVLKLGVGEEIIIGDGTGLEGQCRIVGYQQDAVLLECHALGRNTNEPTVRATLYCAVLKADNFEQAAQKATEAGVAEIVPVITSRTMKFGLRLGRIRTIVREAAELAGRGLVPEVREPTDFDDVLTAASRNDVNYFFDPSGQPFSGPSSKIHKAGIFIGPEGGWDDKEVGIARDLGMKVVSMGPLILRAETAVTIAAYLVVRSAK